jgi:capsular exopolysaccharide synthesis family protein
MELVTYFRLFRKWFWLLFLGAFLAGGAAFLRANRQPDLYRSSVTIQVGTATAESNPNYTGIITAESLAKNYVVLARSYDIAQAAVDAGNFPMSPGGLRGSLSASVIPDTSLIVLTVTYTDPVLAADMANEVARQLIAQSPSNLTTEQEDQIDLQKAEIARLEQELAQARVNLSNLDSQIAATTDQEELQALKDQRVLLVDQINKASSNIAWFSSNIASLQQRTNALTVVEQARAQGGPIGSDVFTQAVLGAIVGAALAAGLALLIEYLDDTVRSPSEATQLLGVPTLAAITRFGKPRDNYAQRLITYRDPGSPISEEYRTLRTNLLFSSNGSAGKGVYIVTSPGPSEGKTITTANLAVTMAMAGWRVLLVDADLRRPRVHDMFDLDNHVGLSTLLSANPGNISPNEDDRYRAMRNLDECIQDTEIPGLRVIASGHIPLNPTEVLGSASMQRWFQEFRARDDIDIVLFDTPPALVVADSAVLASAIEVPVVLVLEAKSTRRGAATIVKEQFDQLNVKVAGLVLNAVDPRDRGEYGYGYGYYYYYYYSDSNTKAGAAN